MPERISHGLWESCNVFSYNRFDSGRKIRGLVRLIRPGVSSPLQGDSRGPLIRHSETEAKAESDSRQRPLLAWFRQAAVLVLIAVVLSFLIKTLLFRGFFVPSTSMADTLEVDDRIFVNLLVPEPFGLARGDIVVFRDTQGWLPEASVAASRGFFGYVEDALIFVGVLPDTSEKYVVKRVIGLPGDRVTCCNFIGQPSVNGSPLDETYLKPGETPRVQFFDVVVPPGKIWVMGDNRNYSADSRAHLDANGGFINLSDVEGRAAVIAWPLNRLKVLDNPSGTFDSILTPPAAD